MSKYKEWAVTVYFQKPPIDEHLEYAFGGGRASMKAEILEMVRSCTVRDPTLQKLQKAIMELDT